MWPENLSLAGRGLCLRAAGKHVPAGRIRCQSALRERSDGIVQLSGLCPSGQGLPGKHWHSKAPQPSVSESDRHYLLYSFRNLPNQKTGCQDALNRRHVKIPAQ